MMLPCSVASAGQCIFGSCSVNLVTRSLVQDHCLTWGEMRRLLAQSVEEHARYDIPHAYKSPEVQGGPISQLPYTSQ